MLLDPEEHLTLQSTNLVKNVYNLIKHRRCLDKYLFTNNTLLLNSINKNKTFSYLATSVGVTQDIVLSEVTVGGHDDDIEHHGNGGEERLQVAWIGCLEEIQQEVDVLKGAASIVTPSLLQSKSLESENQIQFITSTL